MKTVNLRDFYPQYYSEDCFVEVTLEVAAELQAGLSYEETHERTMRRQKVLSLNADDGTETAVMFSYRAMSPFEVMEMAERHCRLCQALNSLPEIQGRRIDAHFLLGISKKEIAEAEGVVARSVRVAINRGLISMREFLKNFD